MTAGADPSPLLAGDWLSGLLRVRPLVLDTGPLTCDVLSAATSRSGLPTPLRIAMQLGVLRGFAASHVWAEVPRVLAKRARQTGVPFEVLESIWWNDYVPLIRFVDCAGLPMTGEAAALTRRDGTDANTLVLAGLLAPVVIVAEDRDILVSGLAYEQWRDFYDVAETIHTGNTHLNAATMAVVLAGHGLVGAGRTVVRAAQNPWLLALAGLGGLLLVTASATWTPRLRASWQRGAEGRRRYRDALSEMLILAALRVRQAEAVWRNAERGTTGTSLLHRVARVLAVAEAPMTRSELVSALAMDRLRSTMAVLANMLHTHGAFNETSRGRWQLGRENMDFGGLASNVPARPR